MNKQKLKDHREIGRELDLFSFREYAPGAVFWHPKGWQIYRSLQDFIRKKTVAEGYEEISTPVMVKSSLFKKSGHLQHFGDNIFTSKVDDEVYALKPMNCPESTLVYSAHMRSYSDLPLRFSDFGILHRNELSGVLGGLLRVRQFTIDDAHIFVRPDQVQEEIKKLIHIVQETYKSLKFEPRFFLATKPEKAMGDSKTWQEAEQNLEKALTESGVEFKIKPKDGAFYGPKIDIHIFDSQKRDWQLATIQLDFQIPQSMQLSYISKDGTKNRPVMIHRGIFGSLERFIGILLEHTQGNLPTWLSPIQLSILPITENQTEYSQKTTTALKNEGFRVKLDSRNETLQAKIRDATIQKVPYLVIIGEKEQKASTVTVRTRKGENRENVKLTELTKNLHREIENKS